MRIHRLLRRAAVLVAVIGTTVAATTAAAAGPGPLAQEQYYSSYSTPEVSAALAQEQYLKSYDAPGAVTAAPAPDASDGTPWLPIALAIAAALLVAGVTATQRRRFRPRRRGAARPAA